MRRFLPNFKNLLGNAQINFISNRLSMQKMNTDYIKSFYNYIRLLLKVDTRARGRYAAIKIENTGVGESWRFGTFQARLTTRWKRG